MRILVSGVGRDSYPTGICRVAASHTRALLSSRVASQVFLAIGSWQYDLFRTLLGTYANQIELVVADIKNNSISRNFWYAATLPRLAKAHGAGLVHLSYPAPAFRGAFSTPVVVTLHDLYPYDIPENFGFPQYFANRAILRQFLSSVDGIACVSHTTWSRLEEIFPAALGEFQRQLQGIMSRFQARPRHSPPHSRGSGPEVLFLRWPSIARTKISISSFGDSQTWRIAQGSKAFSSSWAQRGRKPQRCTG